MSARPIPPMSALTQPYWDAARRGQLALQHCAGCGHRPFPPRATCPSCGGQSLSWSTVSGRATIYSYTIAHRPPHPVFAKQLPLVVAIVELEEGPRMVTNIVGCDPTDVEIGMAVESTSEQIDDTDIALPVFTPMSKSG
jgi:uncharacterized OB-fold protein